MTCFYCGSRDGVTYTPNFGMPKCQACTQRLAQAYLLHRQPCSRCQHPTTLHTIWEDGSVTCPDAIYASND